MDPALDAEVVHQPFRTGAVWTVTDENKPSRDLARDLSEDLDHVLHPLNRPEIGKVNQQGFVGADQVFAGSGANGFIAHRSVNIAVYEIGDNSDIASNAEIGESLVFQVLRDAGNAIALLYGKAGDGQITAIKTNEGDVGSVQGGDEGQAPAAGSEHLAREQRAYGVGNGVMHVEEVEFVEFRHFGHA